MAAATGARSALVNECPVSCIGALLTMLLQQVSADLMHQERLDVESQLTVQGLARLMTLSLHVRLLVDHDAALIHSLSRHVSHVCVVYSAGCDLCIFLWCLQMLYH